MIAFPLNLYYILFASIMLFLLILFVGREEIKTIFWFGLLWGSAATFTIFNGIGALFHLYRYLHPEPFTFLGYPFWNGLAWTPAIILFIHFLPNRKEWYVFPFYIASFAMVSAALDEIFIKLGLLQCIHWNPLIRFLVSLVWLYGAAIHWHKLKLKN